MVSLGERPAREAQSNVELVARVYVVGVADVYGDGHARVPNAPERHGLGLAQLGPLAVGGVLRPCLPVGCLDEVAGEVAHAPRGAPVADHPVEARAVLLSGPRVGL